MAAKTNFRGSFTALVTPFKNGSLDEAAFRSLLDWEPEIVVFGSGGSFRFPHPRLTQSLTTARVGLEVMDSHAACRTFNVLAGEGRKVLAAILL